MRSRLTAAAALVRRALLATISPVARAVVAYMEQEPARFWGNVAMVAVAAYHVANPTGDKGSVISDVITTLAPRIAVEAIRPKVTPVTTSTDPQEGQG